MKTAWHLPLPRALFQKFQSITSDRPEARAIAFGAALPEIENYPDSMLGGAWAWMNDVEDGKGALDAKTMQLIGLAVAAQIPCQYCTHYHRAAALASGATEQEIAEAAVWLDTCATGRRCSMGPAPTSKPTRRWSTGCSPASDTVSA